MNIIIIKLQKLEDLVLNSVKDTLTASNNDREKNAINLMALLTQSFIDIEASDPETFALLSFFDIAEPESYEAAMPELYAAK